MTRPVLLLVSFVAAMGVYLTMILWTLPAITVEAGGLRPFDLRPGGYDLSETRAFLAQISSDGRALYAGPQRILDLVYPALLAVFLGLSIWTAGADLRVLPWVGLALCVAAAGFDYLENARVAGLLASDPDQITAQQVAAASFATVWKSRLTSAAFVLLLALLLRLVWRKWRGQT